MLLLALAVDPADVARITPPARARLALTNTFVSLSALDRASVRFSHGTFTFAAVMSAPYRVEWSNDLRVWLPMALDTVGGSVKLVTATNATNRVGFFRLRALPGPVATNTTWRAAPPWPLELAPSGSTQKAKALP